MNEEEEIKLIEQALQNKGILKGTMLVPIYIY